MESRDFYIEKMKSQLDNLNIQLNAIEIAAVEVKQEGLERYHEETERVKEKSRQAHEKFEELKTSSEDNWKLLVAETEKYRDAFVKSFDYFKSSL